MGSRLATCICAHLAAEAAEVLGVLADLNLLDLLTQGSTVAGAVLADNAHLLRALRLQQGSVGVAVLSKAASGATGIAPYAGLFAAPRISLNNNRNEAAPLARRTAALPGSRSAAWRKPSAEPVCRLVLSVTAVCFVLQPDFPKRQPASKHGAALHGADARPSLTILKCCCSTQQSARERKSTGRPRAFTAPPVLRPWQPCPAHSLRHQSSRPFAAHHCHFRAVEVV